MENPGRDSEEPGEIGLLEMPYKVIAKILQYTNLSTIRAVSMVCRQLNGAARALLNSEFVRLQSLVSNRSQAIDAQLPGGEESTDWENPLFEERSVPCGVNSCLIQRGMVLEEMHGLLRGLTTLRMRGPVFPWDAYSWSRRRHAYREGRRRAYREGREGVHPPLFP